MSATNVNTLWGRAIVDELVGHGIESASLAPGSRSTPLVLAMADHPDLTVFSHLDERSAAFFALGRAKVTDRPTPVVSTSGTAAANFHPAVIEADEARVPMLVLTADRPPELRDSGANQTIDQTRLYGDAPRWGRTLPEPEADARKLRMLRTTVGRACDHSRGVPPGPVHLNVPFRKPLEPVDDGSVPAGFGDAHPRAATGRDGPYVRTARGRPTLEEAAIGTVAAAAREADRGLLVAGPLGDRAAARAIGDLASATGFPVLADPLSGLRFGPPADASIVCGGYDGYLVPDVTAQLADPDVVFRFGAAPTSATLEAYLEGVDARSFLVDPAGGWREATFTATDRLEADPAWLARELSEQLDRAPTTWADRLASLEADYWDLVDRSTLPAEGRIVADVIDGVPPGASVFVSNSMPVRDLDRFGRPTDKPLAALGNRGASGIDGVTSTALGAASGTDGDMVLVTGDLAFYHDMNGLLALGRCGVEATVVLINNDGGGIFHMLPIEDVDPPFTELFKTPHGLDFAPTADLYDLEFRRSTVSEFPDVFATSLDADGSTVIEVAVDAEANHRSREALEQTVIDGLV